MLDQLLEARVVQWYRALTNEILMNAAVTLQFNVPLVEDTTADNTTPKEAKNTNAVNPAVRLPL